MDSLFEFLEIHANNFSLFTIHLLKNLYCQP